MKTMLMNQENRTFYFILACTFITPILFYTGIYLLFPSNQGGVERYLLSIAVFCFLYALAFWGIRKDSIQIRINARKIVEALLFSIFAWILYVTLQLATSMDSMDRVVESIANVPISLILVSIVQTWLFVGFSEEFLFRGYMLTKTQRMFTQQGKRHSTVLAVLVVSAIFSLWHIPNRTFQILTVDMSIDSALFSLVYLYVLAAGFAYLYLRSGNILLVGMIHGLIDLPIIGDGNLTGAILLIAIVLFELYHALSARREKQDLSLQPE